MQPVLRVRRNRPRFARLPTRSLLGLALATLEAGILGGTLLWASVDLLSTEQRALFAQTTPRVVAGVTVGDEPIAGLDAKSLGDELAARSSAWLDAPLRLESDQQHFDTTPRKLGAMHDPRHAVHEALAWGRNPSFIDRVKERLQARSRGVEIPLRARIDPSRTEQVLLDLAPALQREATPGRVDLKARRFSPPTPARGLLVEETIPRVALAMAQGQDRVELATYATVPPEQETHRQRFPDISTIVGQFVVPLDAECPEDAGRSNNRARAIAALDGWVVASQERIGLWSVLGEPTGQRGFSAALSCPPNASGPRNDHGLSSLASAIWSAGFFAGMDLLQASLPDDRIHGVELGLDAQLRWPSEDVELGNPHAFPLVLHVQEQDNKITAQWLGQSRPFKISFERQVLRTKPFDTKSRKDPKALLGSKTTVRAGRPGYVIERKRITRMPGQAPRMELTTLKYPPQSAIVSVGEDPLGPPPGPQKEPKPPMGTEDPKVRITQ